MKLPEIPRTIDGKLQEYLQNFSRAVQNLDTASIKKDQAAGSVLLVSPDGSVYSLTVDNAGTLSTTLVYNA